MERFIRYERITKKIRVNFGEYHTQDFFNELIKDGWEIVYYNETEINSTIDDVYSYLNIVVVVGKKQENNI